MQTRLVLSLVLFRHTYSDIQPLLTSLNRLGPLTSLFPSGVHLFICDNSCFVDPDFLQKIHDSVKSMPISFVCSGVNLGFGKGHNFNSMRANLSESDLVCIVNPDIEFDSSQLIAFLSWFLRSKAVCAAPLIVDSKGSIQYSCKNNPTFLSLLIGRLQFLLRISSLRAYYHSFIHFYFSYRSYLLPCSYLSGCFLVVDGAAFAQVKGFDPKFFLHLEDADFVRRLSSIGLVVHYPFASITHRWARGSHKSFSQMILLFRSYLVYIHKWGFRLF